MYFTEVNEFMFSTANNEFYSIAIDAACSESHCYHKQEKACLLRPWITATSFPYINNSVRTAGVIVFKK